MLKEETVSGTNARRVMNGEEPVEECRKEDEVQKEKKLADAYFQLSLVDSYSIENGELKPRVLDEELRQNYQKAFESCVSEHSGGDEFMKLLSSLTVRDRKTVLDKYSMLLYNHSLEKIHVDEIMDRIKEKKACCVCRTNLNTLTPSQPPWAEQQASRRSSASRRSWECSYSCCPSSWRTTRRPQPPPPQ